MQPSYPSPQQDPSEFQGNRVVRMLWRGREVLAQQGTYAFHQRDVKADSASVVETLGLQPNGLRGVDPLGIGVAFVETASNALLGESTSLASDSMDWIEPVLIDRICFRPNDLYFPQQWGLRAVKAEQAWDLIGDSDVGVVLAVLDSGIPLRSTGFSHPDLRGDRYRLGPDVVNRDDNPLDDNGHGSHVIGIVGASTNNGSGIAGLSLREEILVVKVFDNQGSGSSVTFKDGVLAAVAYAAEKNARLVLNYSGGGPDSNTKRAAVQHAVDQGALLVAAAGNNYGGSVDYPGAYSPDFDSVLAVGSVDASGQRSAFSSRGPEVSLVAPGSEIISTMPDYSVHLNTQGYQTHYTRMSGTSQATPHVAAAAAMVWSKFPQLSASEVAARLLSSANTVSGPVEDFGRGLLNVAAALA